MILRILVAAVLFVVGAGLLAFAERVAGGSLNISHLMTGISAALISVSVALWFL